MQTGIALAAFDADKIHEKLLVRKAKAGGKFLGIGIEKPLTMNEGEIIIEDGDSLIAVYPHKDAESSKITLRTRRAVMLVCGVPSLEEASPKQTAKLTGQYLTRFCGGIQS